MTMPMPAPQLSELVAEPSIGGKLADLLAMSALPDGKYRHWDEVRHRAPPAGLNHREWWAGVKLARAPLLKALPLVGTAGQPFWYGLPDPVQRRLHEVDREASGRIEMAEEVTNPSTRDRYIVSSLIEESITSSQLEGASTTAEVAKNMLRSGRRPIDRSEQMILNNYHAMRFVQEQRERPLTTEFLFELHRMVTENVLDDPAKAGRFREDADGIVVEDHTGRTVHVPPPAAQLPHRLDSMCAFANDRPEDVFIHPVIRAIMLHFWLGYDHPFVDGNGRAARAVFYWSMLNQGYWLTEYLSISRILTKAPGQYARAFLYAETDGNDATYFLIHQLEVIRRALRELQEYLRRKMGELRQVESLLRESVSLNHRQLAVLSRALKQPGARYTIQSHKQSHNVVYQTARTDLLDLTTRGFLIQRRIGKAYVFTAPENLPDILRAAGAEVP